MEDGQSSGRCGRVADHLDATPYLALVSICRTRPLPVFYLGRPSQLPLSCRAWRPSRLPRWPRRGRWLRRLCCAPENERAVEIEPMLTEERSDPWGILYGTLRSETTTDLRLLLLTDDDPVSMMGRESVSRFLGPWGKRSWPSRWPGLGISWKRIRLSFLKM